MELVIKHTRCRDKQLCNCLSLHLVCFIYIPCIGTQWHIVLPLVENISTMQHTLLTTVCQSHSSFCSDLSRTSYCWMDTRQGQYGMKSLLNTYAPPAVGFDSKPYELESVCQIYSAMNTHKNDNDSDNDKQFIFGHVGPHNINCLSLSMKCIDNPIGIADIMYFCEPLFMSYLCTIRHQK